MERIRGLSGSVSRKKGRECIEALKGIMSDMEEVLYQGITPEEKMLFRRLVLEMRKNLLESKDFKGVDFQTIIEKTGPPVRHGF